MADGKGIDQPNGMKLVIDFSGLGAFRNEVLNLLYLGFVSGLEAWRIMEDEFGVAGKDEWTIDIVDSALTKIWESKVQFAERDRVNYLCSWIDLLLRND